MNLLTKIYLIKFNCRYNFSPILNHLEKYESFEMENNKDKIER